MGVGEFGSAPEITCRSEAEGVQSREVKDVTSGTGREVGDVVGEIGEVFAGVGEGVGAGTT